MTSKTMLLSMPWHQFDITSIQLGGLKAFLQHKGLSVDTRHYYKDVAAYIDQPTYQAIIQSAFQELFFAALLFPEYRASIRDIVTAHIDYQPFDFDECIGALEQFLTDILDDVPWADYSLVGFSCTHVQSLSSILLARVLKERHPHLKTVMGGFLLRDGLATDVLDTLPFIDFVVAGEGENALYKLILALQERGDLSAVPSLAFRLPDGSVTMNGHVDPVLDLDSLPVPDYSDYLNYSLRFMLPPHPKIQVETSRGCAWGQCSFCVETMPSRRSYRRRSTRAVIEEIEHQTKTYGSVDVLFADADMADKMDLFEAICDIDIDLNLSVECTGFLSKGDLVTLRRAGVTHLQTGFESPNNRLLKIFRKGVTVIQYVEILKWCKEVGIDTHHNMVLGAPFETEEDMDVIVDNMKNLRYFQPPLISQFAVSYQADIFRDPKRYGIEAIVPHRGFERLFPRDIGQRLAPLIAFGENTGYAFLPESKIDHEKVLSALERWTAEYDTFAPTLVCRRGSGFLDIVHKGETKIHIVLRTEIEKAIYLFCIAAAKRECEIRDKFRETDAQFIGSILTKFVNQGIMYRDRDWHLSLASLEREETIETSRRTVPPLYRRKDRAAAKRTAEHAVSE